MLGAIILNNYSIFSPCKSNGVTDSIAYEALKASGAFGKCPFRIGADHLYGVFGQWVGNMTNDQFSMLVTPYL